MKIRLSTIVTSFGFLIIVLGILTTASALGRAETYGGEVTALKPEEGKLTVMPLAFEAERGRNREIEFTVQPNPDYPQALPLEDLEVGDLVLIEAGKNGEVDSLISGWGGSRGVVLLRGDDAKGGYKEGAS